MSKTESLENDMNEEKNGKELNVEFEEERMKKCGFTTLAVHVGQEAESLTGALIPPIFLTSTFLQNSPSNLIQGYDYTRAGNPNFTMLESQIAVLESAKYTTVFSSGMAALTSLLSSIPKDKGVCALRSCYGGTYRLLKNVFEVIGLSVHLVDVGDYEGLDKILSSFKIKYFIFETPTNPLNEIIDIAKVTEIAKKYKVFTVLDNTFATPFLQNPLKCGVDVVVHSTTKFLGGHSDVIGGAICTNSAEIKESCDFMRKSMGLNPSPFDTWLLARSIKTFSLRMACHCSNALKLAEYLSDHENVNCVYYPGLKYKNKKDGIENEFYAIACKQMRNGFGGVISVQFNFDLDLTKKFISSLKIFALAESLGGVESLVEHPSSMTHASMPHAERLSLGIADGLIRFAVGIEDFEDLKNDIDCAISSIKNSNALQ